jgi:hypothetical protein
VSSTIEAALPFAAGQAAAGLVSARVVALTDGVLRSMVLAKVKLAAVGLVALAVLGTGVGSFIHRAGADTPGSQEATAPRTPSNTLPDTARQPSRGEVARPRQFAGTVTAVGAEGKTFTLEVPAQVRGEEPTKVAITLGDRTTVDYQGVAPGGASPTQGYAAQVRLVDGPQDMAARVTFTGPEMSRPQAELIGTVVAVARDGKGITVELGEPRRERGAEPRKVAVPFDDRTLLVYSHVTRGGASPAEGYSVQVWLADDSTTAAKVHFLGKEQAVQRGERRPDVAGRIVAVANDGRTLTVEMAAAVRGEEPPKVVVQVGDGTAIVYDNVGTAGTTIAEGFHVGVWLEEGSRDRAARMSVTGVVPERWTMVVGKVVGVSKDGTTITVEQPPPRDSNQSRERRERREPVRVNVKLIARTRIVYCGVGPDEARPEASYDVEARLADGPGDVAAQITFRGPAGARGR